MNPKRASELRERLILTESRFEQTMEVKNDPIDLVSRYKDPRDQEVAALIAAVFSYGNVKQIQSTLDHVFTMLGPSPASTIKKATGADW